MLATNRLCSVGFYLLLCLHERLQHHSYSGRATPCKCLEIRDDSQYKKEALRSWKEEGGQKHPGRASGGEAQCPLLMLGPQAELPARH